jgi:hypothetical protein
MIESQGLSSFSFLNGDINLALALASTRTCTLLTERTPPAGCQCRSQLPGGQATSVLFCPN